jgi:pyrroline-5-carboxylate reductase
MKIGIIGMGNMGKSLFRLLSKNRFEMNITLSDKNKENTLNGHFVASVEKNIEISEILFICVKPNDIYEVLKLFENVKNKTIVSCVAGVKLKDIQKLHNNQTMRIMTNLPIEYRKGSISYFSENLSKSTEEKILNLCKGPKIFKLETENLLDVTTLLGGSMPAFSAHLAQEYINFGIRNGLTEKQSKEMYISSIEGTLEMMKNDSNEFVIKNIIDKVSSPKGITMKGIQYLEYSNVNKHIKDSLDFCLDNISKLSEQKT